MDIGSAVGRKVGVTEAQLYDLARYQESPAFSPLERLVIEYSEAITQTPVEVSEALFAALRQSFNEAQLVELTAAIAWENYRARFDHAFGIEAQGFSAGAFCVLAERPPEASAVNGKVLGSSAT
jgi:alkylhydroperoxidase family enzyme